VVVEEASFERSTSEEVARSFMLMCECAARSSDQTQLIILCGVEILFSNFRNHFNGIIFSRILLCFLDFF
jgi:hypothetical protein